MKTLKKIVEEYLCTETRFRERKNKDRGIANLLIQRYPELETIRKETIIEAIKDYGSMDRCWRKILEEREELRGADYNDKEMLEQQVQVDLGYEPIKKLNI